MGLVNKHYGSSDPILECWCDKVGGRMEFYGQCSDKCIELDILLSDSSIKHNRKSRRTKRERDLRYKKKMKQKAKLYHGVYYCDEKCVHGKGFVPVRKPYCKRFYRDKHKNGRYSYYKTYSNRVVRRYKGTIANGGAYKKVFDYWWTVD